MGGRGGGRVEWGGVGGGDLKRSFSVQGVPAPNQHSCLNRFFVFLCGSELCGASPFLWVRVQSSLSPEKYKTTVKLEHCFAT